VSELQRCGRIGNTNGGRSSEARLKVAALQSKPLGSPDDVRLIPKGSVETYALNYVAFERTILEPGWRWSQDVRPIAGTELCRYHHVGLAVSGSLGVQLEDGSSAVVGPDQVYEIPAGHDAWVIGAEPFITVVFAGDRSYALADEGGSRMLGAVLFTDIVESTATAARLGPAHWAALLESHGQDVRLVVDRYGGRLVKSTGDGFLAMFDGSERAVRAAAAIVASARLRDIEVRAGVHTGEVGVAKGDLHGIAVHTAARVAAIAGPSEVLVSDTTSELVQGTSLVFEDAGVHELKGVPGDRRLFRLSR
jgi:class 3 adenylate cyclase